MTQTVLLPNPALREPARRIPTRVGRHYFVRTFGCQMNVHDSERIAGLFEADGMQSTDGYESADVVYINTCTIRENADNRMYGNLGQLKAIKDINPKMMLVVGGCAAQKDRDMIREKAPWVDVVMGTHNLDRVLDLLDHAEQWGPITEVVRRAAPLIPPVVFTAITIFAVANTALVNYVTASRLLYGMARQGLLPNGLGKIHVRRRTPHIAIVALFLVAAVLALWGTISQLAAATVLLLLVVFSVVNASLIAVRNRKGEPAGRFQVPLVVPVLGLLVCLLLIGVRVASADWQAPALAGGLIACILVLYFVMRPKAIPAAGQD